jgi:vacuolar protein sorting-associated protein 26
MRIDILLLSMSFFFGPNCDIQIIINEIPKRRKLDWKDKNGNLIKIPIFLRDEDIAGKVVVKPHKGKKVEHQGIIIELIGHIEINGDKNQSTDFKALKNELQSPGIITEEKVYDFNFSKVDKEYETYQGIASHVRYFLRVTMNKGKGVKEEDFAIMVLEEDPLAQSTIKMEVGIEDCVHIEFEYNKGKYHLKDVIEGTVNFVLVRLKLKFMELQIVKKEVIGSGNNAHTESENICKFEVMDGVPARGEVIPIRMFIKSPKLTPTYITVKDRFSVKYYLNLVLVDEEDRKYFKQQEITFWRKKI